MTGCSRPTQEGESPHSRLLSELLTIFYASKIQSKAISITIYENIGLLWLHELLQITSFDSFLTQAESLATPLDWQLEPFIGQTGLFEKYVTNAN
jgi:hypothetical protein